MKNVGPARARPYVSRVPLVRPNRFSVLGVDEVEEADLSPPSPAPPKKKKPPQKKRVRVHVFGDSQCRGVSKHVKDESPRHAVTGSCRPGAGTAQVLSEVRGLTSSFKTKDCVVIMAGTNDTAQSEGKSVAGLIRHTLRGLAARAVVCTVPWRHDKDRRSEENRRVREVNEDIKKMAADFRNVRVFDLAALGRGCYTRDGFHLNDVGKRRTAEVVSSFIDSYAGFEEVTAL